MTYEEMIAKENMSEKVRDMLIFIEEIRNDSTIPLEIRVASVDVNVSLLRMQVAILVRNLKG